MCEGAEHLAGPEDPRDTHQSIAATGVRPSATYDASDCRAASEGTKCFSKDIRNGSDAMTSSNDPANGAPPSSAA